MMSQSHTKVNEWEENKGWSSERLNIIIWLADCVYLNMNTWFEGWASHSHESINSFKQFKYQLNSIILNVFTGDQSLMICASLCVNSSWHSTLLLQTIFYLLLTFSIPYSVKIDLSHHHEVVSHIDAIQR